MNSVIYTLIIVGWVIYNLYKAGKKISGAYKKAQQPVSGGAAKSQRKDARTLLEEIKEKKQQTTTARPSLEEILDETAFDTELAYEGETSFENSTRVDAQLQAFNSQYNKSSESHSVHNETILTETEQEQNNLLNDWDLKKAVIYSEILKRPVYN